MVHKMTPGEIRKEREADLFARCLLMPEEMFKKELLKIRECNNTLQKTVDIIAKKFQVEPVHATLRLKDLKLI